jgi:uncharacterized repeat protein (TIGR01451 family)
LAARALWLCALLALIAASALGVALPAEQAAAQVIGGTGFKLTSLGGGQVRLDWNTGTGQTGFRINRISAGGTVVVASPVTTATTFTDTLPPTVSIACYQLQVLGASSAVLGNSEILCVIANVAGGTSPVRNISIEVVNAAAVRVTWTAPATLPAGAGLIGYLAIPLGKTPLAPIPAGTNQAIDIPGAPTCYIVLTLITDSGLVPFRIGGFSDIVCAFPGTATGVLAPQATATPTRTNTVGVPTNTNTPAVVTATFTNTPGGATSTNTPATPTNTPVVVTATNTATATGTATPTATLIPANLTILKVDNPDPVGRGQNLVYTITVANTGQAGTGPLVFRDPLPAGLTFSSVSATGPFEGNCFHTVQNNSVGCDSQAGFPGFGTLNIQISTVVDNVCFFANPIVNTAQSQFGGPITSNSPSASASTTVSDCPLTGGPSATATATRTPTSTATSTATPSIDLSILKFDAPDPLPVSVAPNATATPVALQYTLQVFNNGTISASGITVEDYPPVNGNWTFGAAAGENGFLCNFNPVTRIITCTGGQIGAHASATITIVLNVQDCGGAAFLTNNATVDPANIFTEFNESNNTSFAVTACGAGANTATPFTPTFSPTATATATRTPTTLPAAAASFLKTSSNNNPQFGQAFDYTLTFTNNSPSTINGIQINDNLPVDVTFLGSTNNGGFTCTPIGGAATGDPNGQLVCTGGSVPSGEARTITISVAITNCATPITNTATVIAPSMAAPGNISTTVTPVQGCATVTPTVTLTPSATLSPTVTVTGTATPPTIDTTIAKAQVPANGVVSTVNGAAAVQYTLTLTDVLQSNVAPSTVTDILPAGFVVQGTPTVNAGSTGTCTVSGVAPAAQTVTCTNVGGPEPVIITINAQVPTTVAAGGHTNTATVVTTADTNAVNNTSNTVTTTVVGFDVAVDVVGPAVVVTNPVAPVTYNYVVTVSNTSAGGVASGAFFVNGGLSIRNCPGPGDPSGNLCNSIDASLVANINTITATGGIACVLTPNFQNRVDRYSCSVPSLAAGTSQTITIGVLTTGLDEPDGLPDVSLDANAATGANPACVGGGLLAGCAPEGTSAPAALLTNNRDIQFTDIDGIVPAP